MHAINNLCAQLSHSPDLISSAHKLVSRAHELVSHAHELVSGVHERHMHGIIYFSCMSLHGLHSDNNVTECMFETLNLIKFAFFVAS